MLSLPVAVGVVLASSAAGLWGHLLGILVRSPIVVLFVVPLTLSPGAVIANTAPAIADVLPLQALIAAAGLSIDSGLDRVAAAGVVLTWLVALAAAAVIVTGHRDRL